MRDLTDRADIKVIIDDFYEKVWLDDLLEPIFSNAVAKSKFLGHLETMYDFWESVLFGDLIRATLSCITLSYRLIKSILIDG